MNIVRQKYIQIYAILGILIPLLFIVISCASNFQKRSNAGIIKGVVFDENNRPLSNAQIKLWQGKKDNLFSSVKALSNSSGEFTIKKFPQNGGRITIDASGYCKYIIDIPWDNGLSEIMLVPMIKKDSLWSDLLGLGTIIGKTVDKRSEEAIPGTIVILEGTKMGAAANFDGSFKIPNIPTGVYNISAYTIGFAHIIYQGIVVNADSTTKVDFYMYSIPIVMHSNNWPVIY